ncbi:solute carrier family 25 (mitochondrial phosphate transporter), member 3 [Marchantia polymorpha subsp. ruderalis]|uniref:Uncharacterized protein n=2 Tax=Marchantia polymorpha TaxID=3197 RepID=A0AAF6BFR9_MARPO|nr:hypothetical protein MARPO_0136s0026 [Marchantia polymorpha]BBN10853.1 hypothetical protein Mp_5g06960 [Marchantia polymorpha subsp. ruderalis]|eukprot:PTQ29698.1 hypothetical protein MARPO_0136s0026 [Marchantia polymorpha]
MDPGTETTWASRLRGQKIEMEIFTAKYYAACAAGGMVSAGSVHFLVTPFDMLKVNMQANPVKYRNIWSGFGIVWKEQGLPGLWRGWGGKLFGYSAQGACKFGLYEYFKKSYCDLAGPVNSYSYKTPIYLAASSSAQVIADIALCPFEAIKVRVQSQPGFGKGLADGFPKVYRSEGIRGFYKGLMPLWGRNVPFAMLLFSSFEHSVDFIYSQVLQRRKLECPRGVQLGVTCVAGYVSGVAGTIVSNPADNIITHMYNNKGATFSQSIKSIGWVGLFTRSLPLRIMLVGPIVTTQWFAFDLLKVSLGLPTSGGMDQHVSYIKSRTMDQAPIGNAEGL